MRTIAWYFEVCLFMLAMISPGVAQTAINDDNSVRPGTLPSSNMPKTPNRTQDNATPPDVLVSSGDLLAVGVLGAPDYHYDLRVSSSGEISLPMAGSMYVAGLTTPQAERTIAPRAAIAAKVICWGNSVRLNLDRRSY